MKLELVRFAYLSTCTLGWLTGGGLRLATIEDAWRRDVDGPGGQRREGEELESCPPDGLYVLEPHTGAKWSNVWALVNPALGVWHWKVPDQFKGFGRSALLLHSGTDERSSLGCIILGVSHGIIENRHRVFDSPTALNQLRATLIAGSHTLQIRPRAGTTED